MFQYYCKSIFLSVVVFACSTTGIAQADWYDEYQNLSSINTKLDEFLTSYPSLVSDFSIGTSYEGRDIRAIKISGTGGTKSTKPAVFLYSMLHSREWVTPMATMYASEQLLSQYGSDSEITEMLDDVEFYIVPVVNPDGYEYSWVEVNGPFGSVSYPNRQWRKNRRDNGDGTFGVDLNRNWGVGWGGNGSSGNTSSDIYRGEYAFSEPETAALRDFYYNNPNIVSNIDLHSYSQLILGPYGYSFTEEPADAAILSQLGAKMSQSIYDVHGEIYVSQPAHDLYQASGISSDWAYGSENVYSYTYELRPNSPSGGGFELPEVQIKPTVEETFAGILDLGNFTATLASGDFNYDMSYSLSDIDALADGIVNGTSKAEYDVNGDAMIDPGDVKTWRINAGKENRPSEAAYRAGDANLDGKVDQDDIDIWSANENMLTSDWSRGDFNSDGIVNDLDLNILQWSIQHVPEPNTLALSMLGFALIAKRRRVNP